jgi:hypothetical protein
MSSRSRRFRGKASGHERVRCRATGRSSRVERDFKPPNSLEGMSMRRSTLRAVGPKVLRGPSGSRPVCRLRSSQESRDGPDARFDPEVESPTRGADLLPQARKTRQRCVRKTRTLQCRAIEANGSDAVATWPKPTPIALLWQAGSSTLTRRIGIGGRLTTPPLPHHRTYGSVYGGSVNYAVCWARGKEGRVRQRRRLGTQ